MTVRMRSWPGRVSVGGGFIDQKYRMPYPDPKCLSEEVAPPCPS